MSPCEGIIWHENIRLARDLYIDQTVDFASTRWLTRGDAAYSGIYPQLRFGPLSRNRLESRVCRGNGQRASQIWYAMAIIDLVDETRLEMPTDSSVPWARESIGSSSGWSPLKP